MGIETILNWISIGLIIIWTIRLASAKGQNPWVWALTSVCLMAIPYFFNQPFLGLLGMAPMLYLLILRKKPNKNDIDTLETGSRINCSKCDVSHLDTYKFCVNCGWELGQTYNIVGDDNSQYDSASSSLRAETISPDVLEEDELDVKRQIEVFTDTASSPNENTDSLTEESTPAPFLIPSVSAQSLTSKGENLFTEGRFQESVDQFTKAIALDPRYHLAWAKRAEAYVRMGLTQKAEEDLRSLEGI